jgi:hypothetical protein
MGGMPAFAVEGRAADYGPFSQPATSTFLHSHEAAAKQQRDQR